MNKIKISMSTYLLPDDEVVGVATEIVKIPSVLTVVVASGSIISASVV